MIAASLLLLGIPVSAQGNVSVATPNPASGSGSNQTFTLDFDHTGGWAQLQVLNILINAALDGRQACYLAFLPAPTVPNSGTLVLVNDEGGSGGPYAGELPLPSTGAIENSACSISGGESMVSTSGTRVRLILRLSFKAPFAGNHVIYLAARGHDGSNTGWVSGGVWNVPSATPPSPRVVSVSPVPSSAGRHTLTAVFADDNGFPALDIVNLLIQSAIDGRQACYVAFVRSTNTLALVNDEGEAGGPFAGIATVPAGGVIQNGQCAIDTASSSISTSGSTLRLILEIRWKTPFSGTKIIYAAARDNQGRNSGWQAAATVAANPVDPPPVLGVAPATLTYIGPAGGTNPAGQSFQINNSVGATLNWTAVANQPWLTLSSTSGTAPSTVTANVSSVGLSAGLHTAVITVTSTGTQGSPATVAVQLTLTGPAPTLSLAPATLEFVAVAGNPSPPPQNLSITNPTGGTLNWNASVTQPWLSISPASGIGPASIAVSIVTAGLAPGNYGTTVTVSAQGATGSPKSIPIQLTVLGTPSNLSFTGIEGGTDPVPQALNIQAGTGAAWTAAPTQPWISVTPASGTGPATAIVRVSLTGLGAAAYAGKINVNYGGATQTSPVGLTVSLPPPALSVSHNAIAFTASAGSQPPSQKIVLANTGGNQLSWNVTTDQPWLSATPSNGTARPSLSIDTGVTPLPVSGVPTTLANTGGGTALHNGIVLSTPWPPVRSPTQEYTVPFYLATPPAVIPIDTGRQLFVDDFLVESTTLARTRHLPRMFNSNPILAPEPGDRYATRLPFSDGAWFDPADNKFKLFYFGPSGYQVFLIESLDGHTWLAPGEPVFNIGSGRDSATVWLDLEETNPDRRWKAFAYYPATFLRIYFSPDGRNWTEFTPSGPNTSDRTTAFLNPWRHVWSESLRIRATVPETATRPISFVRVRLYSETTDFGSWNPAAPAPLTAFWTGADDRDPTFLADPASSFPELYNLDATPYESIFVGLFSWFYPGDQNGLRSGPDIVEIGEGFSRDGYQWWRPFRGAGQGRAFIPVSNTEGTWNQGNTQSAGGGFLVVGDELWFYFSGRDHLHSGEGKMSTGLAKMRRDGFASMDAGAQEGVLTTRPIRFTGSYLFVNVDNPAGSLQAEILDSNGAVIPSFSRANCQVITTNSTLRQVLWSGGSNLSSLAGQNVRIRFYLSQGSLYSFWVTSSAAGASNGYVAAGGPGFTSNRDTVGTAVFTATPHLIEAPEVSVSVSTAGLAPGGYTGKVFISSPGVTATPREVQVTLTVNAP